eukprot:3460850-Pyramimonas_sp.AAC.1
MAVDLGREVVRVRHRHAGNKSYNAEDFIDHDPILRMKAHDKVVDHKPLETWLATRPSPLVNRAWPDRGLRKYAPVRCNRSRLCAEPFNALRVLMTHFSINSQSLSCTYERMKKRWPNPPPQEGSRTITRKGPTRRGVHVGQPGKTSAPYIYRVVPTSTHNSLVTQIVSVWKARLIIRVCMYQEHAAQVLAAHLEKRAANRNHPKVLEVVTCLLAFI